jgi:hypothetical protein
MATFDFAIQVDVGFLLDNEGTSVSPQVVEGVPGRGRVPGCHPAYRWRLLRGDVGFYPRSHLEDGGCRPCVHPSAGGSLLGHPEVG